MDAGRGRLTVGERQALRRDGYVVVRAVLTDRRLGPHPVQAGPTGRRHRRGVGRRANRGARRAGRRDHHARVWACQRGQRV